MFTADLSADCALATVGTMNKSNSRTNLTFITKMVRSNGAAVKVDSCNQAISQVCAFHSPFQGILSDMEMYRQLG
jgi:hypothetical protein